MIFRATLRPARAEKQRKGHSVGFLKKLKFNIIVYLSYLPIFIVRSLYVVGLISSIAEIYQIFKLPRRVLNKRPFNRLYRKFYFKEAFNMMKD